MAIETRDERVLRRIVVAFLLLAALQLLGIRYRGIFRLNLTDGEPIGL
ncbi:hypothetical protein [Geomonas ferrireducens]|nr:hypothetical protein [Geomonas ferrireducens]